MKKLLTLATICILTVAGLGGATVASADTTNPRFIVYENENAGGDHWTICNSSVCTHNFSDLHNYNTGLTPTCNGNPFQFANWNDCINSIRMYDSAVGSSTKYCVAFYDGANYTNRQFVLFGDNYADGTVVNLNPDQVDRTTSIAWRSYSGSSVNCTSQLPG